MSLAPVNIAKDLQAAQSERADNARALLPALRFNLEAKLHGIRKIIVNACIKQSKTARLDLRDLFDTREHISLEVQYEALYDWLEQQGVPRKYVGKGIYHGDFELDLAYLA